MGLCVKLCASNAAVAWFWRCLEAHDLLSGSELNDTRGVGELGCLPVLARTASTALVWCWIRVGPGAGFDCMRCVAQYLSFAPPVRTLLTAPGSECRVIGVQLAGFSALSATVFPAARR
jgi:hypothetical protein